MKKAVKKSISIICTICLITCILCGYASADILGQAQTAETSYSSVSIYFNGIKTVDGIKVEDTTYVPLRAFFGIFGDQTDIAWDAETNTVTVTDQDLILTATVGANYITINDRCFYLPEGVLIIDGNLSLPVRELAQVYQVEVEWNDEADAVSLTTDGPVMLDGGDDYYVADDLYWLARLINAEAGNQPLDGKIAVGNVVLNRVADPTCPDSIYNVIFDSKYGVQFSVTENGGIYAEPNEESIVAAKICLEGYDIVGDSIYFVNPDIGVSSWFSQTRVYVATIGQHDFYA